MGPVWQHFFYGPSWITFPPLCVSGTSALCLWPTLLTLHEKRRGVGRLGIHHTPTPGAFVAGSKGTTRFHWPLRDGKATGDHTPHQTQPPAHVAKPFLRTWVQEGVAGPRRWWYKRKSRGLTTKNPTVQCQINLKAESKGEMHPWRQIWLHRTFILSDTRETHRNYGREGRLLRTMLGSQCQGWAGIWGEWWGQPWFGSVLSKRRNTKERLTADSRHYYTHSW